MKTLKLALVASLAALLIANAASADGFKSRPQFKLRAAVSLEQAMQNPGLVVAIYNQVSPADVLNYGLPPYTFEVKYNRTLYVVTGSLQEWLIFFRIKGISPPVKVTKSAIKD